MNGVLLLAGFTALVTSVDHIFPGGNDVAKPLLAADVVDDAKYALYACWHFVSGFFVTSSFMFLATGLNLWQGGDKLIIVLSVLWLLFGFSFLFVAFGAYKPSHLFRLPQWVLLFPVGVLGLLGESPLPTPFWRL